MTGRAARARRALVTAVLLAAFAAPAATASSTSVLEAREHQQVVALRESGYTLAFFRHHQRLMWTGPLVRRFKALEVYRWHQARVVWVRRELRETRAALEQARVRSRLGDVGAWACIHEREGAWNDPNAPYYGGLQMDMEFQQTYGPELLRSKGTADNWTPQEQMMVAERARASGRGYYPWPNTARACGLI